MDIDNIQAENTEELLSQEKPMYLFVPVDRYGDNEEDAEPLKDLGMNHWGLSTRSFCPL